MTSLRDFLLDRRTAHVHRWHHRPVMMSESIAEHHALTARIAFFVATLGRYHDIPEFDNADPRAVAAGALFHDEPEIVTGDTPGDQKMIHPDLKAQVDVLEARAWRQLADEAPRTLVAEYMFCLQGSGVGSIGLQIIKYADDLAALAYIEDEMKMGNRQASVWETFRGVRDKVKNRDWPWLVKLRECEPELP